MHDLPSQTLLQQDAARPVSGEHLEVLGKHAADCYHDGTYDTLNEAVVETVKQAGLSPEQVQRVIEFANTSAYLREFRKEGSTHKYINFPGGPASPSEVLKDLNDGGGGTVFDRGMADYNQPPPTAEKTADVTRRNLSRLGLEKEASAFESSDEQMLREAFEVPDNELPFADPWQDSIQMRDKLASARDTVVGEIGSFETEFMLTCEDLYAQVKQAAMDGVHLGQIVQLWGEVVPGPNFVKLAFQQIGPRLAAEKVLTLDEIGASLEKTASGLPNLEHPLVGVFSAYCIQLEKLATARAALDELCTEHDRVDWFLKTAHRKVAQGGIVGAAKKLHGAAKQVSGKVAPIVGKAIGGEPGRYAAKAVEYAPEAAEGLLALEAYDRAVKHGPLGGLGQFAKARIPGTQEYYMRQMALSQNPGLF